MKIITPSPYFFSVKGHYFPYYQSMQNALADTPYTLEFLVPKKTSVSLEKNRKYFFSHSENKLVRLYLRTKEYLELFRRIKPGTTLFIESYSFLDLVSLSISTVFHKKSTYLIFFLRDDMCWNKKKRFFFLAFLKWTTKWYRKRVSFVTDTQCIQNSTQKSLRETIHLLPIPHTRMMVFSKKKAMGKVVWAPGDPNQEKGKEIILSVLENSLKQEEYSFFVSSKYEPFLRKKNKNVHFLPSHLTNEEYEEMLQKADIVLLPYDKNTFQSRSSGVFVEAIAAGKMVVTTESTWLASELIRFQLNQYVLEFSSFAEKFYALLKDASWDLKSFEKMQREYRSFHCEKTFSIKMKQILQDLHGGKK